MGINNRNTDLHKGRIIFKEKNIKCFKKEIFNVFINILISIIFGFIGSVIFITIYSDFYNIDDSKTNLKYDYNITQVINRLNQSVVGINAYIREVNNSGEHNLVQNNMTGVLYSEDGYIVTNFYGLNNANKIYVKIPSTLNLVKEAKVVGYNEKYDICLLKIDGNEYVKGVFKENISDVSHGLKVVSMGNSSGDFNSYHVNSGIISGFDIFDDGIKIIKTDINVNFSNTGGPISDVNGEILGISSVKFNDSYNIHKETSSILISSQDIIKLIEEMIEGAT